MSNQEVFVAHLKAFAEGDLDTIMGGYAEDAVLLTPQGVMKGPAQIRAAFAEIFANYVQPGTSKLEKQLFEGEYGYIVWSADTPTYNVPLGTDTFVIRDGKIVAQSFAAQLIPKAK